MWALTVACGSLVLRQGTVQMSVNFVQMKRRDVSTRENGRYLRSKLKHQNES